MKDVTDLRVRQYRIFPADVIPYLVLSTKPGVSVMAERLAFRDIGQDPPEAIFTGGACLVSESRTVIVLELRINPRRIILEVLGGSADAEAVFDHVWRLLQEFSEDAPRMAAAKPIVLTEETTCAATLDLDWQSLVSSGFASFLKESLLPAAGKGIAQAAVHGLRLSAAVRYDAVTERIREHDITLASKLFTVEPRAQEPLDSHRFFTSSPLDSEAHLQMLRELERRLGSASSKRPKKARQKVPGKRLGIVAGGVPSDTASTRRPPARGRNRLRPPAR